MIPKQPPTSPMTTQNRPAEDALKEQPFVSHLMELRDRLMRAAVAVLIIFIGLFPFANDIYQFISKPLLEKLPQGQEMIATGVISPFLAPFKLTLVVAILSPCPSFCISSGALSPPDSISTSGG
jgi:sec-independent protein translocase protein TatC